MRLVLDTDVIIAGLRSPAGGAAALLREIRQGRSTLLLSPALVLEYEAQCNLLEHRRASGLTSEQIDDLLDSLVLLAEPVQTFFRWRPQLRDPGDEMVLEAAVNGRAEVIVTFNRRDYRDGPARFCIEVLTPGEPLRKMCS
jgi:putative PIN family toxin of toxin-antitoxin system